MSDTSAQASIWVCFSRLRWHFHATEAIDSPSKWLASLQPCGCCSSCAETTVTELGRGHQIQSSGCFNVEWGLFHIFFFLGTQRAVSFLIVMTRNNYPGKVLSKSSAEPRNGLLRAGLETVYSSQRMRIREFFPLPHPNPNSQTPLHPTCRFHQTQREVLQDALHIAGEYWEGTWNEQSPPPHFRVIHYFHNVYCNLLVVKPFSADQ